MLLKTQRKYIYKQLEAPFCYFNKKKNLYILMLYVFDCSTCSGQKQNI